MTPFRKMNGLGNDFLVVDARARPFHLPADRVRRLADRRTGVGFDQLIVIEPSSAGEDATMRIVNADGGEVESCGNAARCVAGLLLEEGRERVTLGSVGGTMRAWAAGDGTVAVDMGPPRFGAGDIPLADPSADPLALDFPERELARFGPAACVNVGNPHAVFFVADLHAVPLAQVGSRLETHPAFPQRANISFAVVERPDLVSAVVHERGVGPTRACGTAACAIAAVGARLGRLAEAVTVRLPGGPLEIGRDGESIVMVGPTALDWTGILTDDGFLRDPG